MFKNLYVLFLMSAASLFASELNVDLTANNKVIFISEATVESFEGTTDKIDGYLLWEGDDYTNKSEFYFEVDLASLDTGIGLRNRHMRENYLETDKFPFAAFSGKVVNVDSVDENTLDVVAKGTFNLHGIKKELEIPVNVSIHDTGYNVKSNFNVNLNDYDIKIPKLMFLKINEIIKVELDFNLTKVKDN